MEPTATISMTGTKRSGPHFDHSHENIPLLRVGASVSKLVTNAERCGRNENRQVMSTIQQPMKQATSRKPRGSRYAFWVRFTVDRTETMAPAFQKRFCFRERMAMAGSKLKRTPRNESCDNYSRLSGHFEYRLSQP